MIDPTRIRPQAEMPGSSENTPRYPMPSEQKPSVEEGDDENFRPISLNFNASEKIQSLGQDAQINLHVLEPQHTDR